MPELPHHILNVSTLPTNGHEVVLRAESADLATIALECGLESVSSFLAKLSVNPWHKDGVTVAGCLDIEYVQNCVVTLEPMKQCMSEKFETRFAPASSRLFSPHYNAEGEMVVDYSGDDPPEPFEGQSIDLWAVLIEQFNLRIDPFPRQSGAVLSDTSDEIADTVVGESPFSVLKSLKRD